MNADDFIKLPRLYVDSALSEGAILPLEEAQAHYLRTVLRREAGDTVRLFNGRDGEWVAALETPTKKSAVARPQQKIKDQPAAVPETHLLFAPIKKAQLAWLIEKAVELGATHLHPVLTHHTENRFLNDERTRAQVIEAAEQCERLDIPELYPAVTLDKLLGGWKGAKIFAALERTDAAPLSKQDLTGPAAFLTGPEGGFSAAEKSLLSRHPAIVPVSLGNTILRAETAALYCLSVRRCG